MMMQKIVERGGLAAEDEAHVKHVMVSRPRTRLVYISRTSSSLTRDRV